MVFNEEKFPLIDIGKLSNTQFILDVAEFFRPGTFIFSTHKESNIVYESLKTKNNYYVSNTFLEKIKNINKNIGPEKYYKHLDINNLKKGGTLLTSENTEAGKYQFSWFDREGISIYFSMFVGYDRYASFQIFYNGNTPEWVEFCNDYSDCDLSSKTGAETILGFLFLLQKSEIEINVLDKLTPRKKINKEKYLNKTGIPIKIIDSNWFTTTIQGESFGVSGHFRLQPCGVNSQDRKLIWINEFKKNGYTRKAGILNK